MLTVQWLVWMFSANLGSTLFTTYFMLLMYLSLFLKYLFNVFQVLRIWLLLWPSSNSLLYYCFLEPLIMLVNFHFIYLVCILLFLRSISSVICLVNSLYSIFLFLHAFCRPLVIHSFLVQFFFSLILHTWTILDI